MKIAVDVSLYPLRDDYVPPIDAIIRRFDEFAGVDVTRHALSTELRGEYRAVMACLTEATEAALAGSRPAVVVAKIVASERIG